jgi:hypothetical protein
MDPSDSFQVGFQPGFQQISAPTPTTGGGIPVLPGVHDQDEAIATWLLLLEDEG